MDLATAKTLVSAALVASIALFSLVAFRAFIAQVADDLRSARAGRSEAVPGPVPVRVDRPRQRID